MCRAVLSRMEKREGVLKERWRYIFEGTPLRAADPESMFFVCVVVRTQVGLSAGYSWRDGSNLVASFRKVVGSTHVVQLLCTSLCTSLVDVFLLDFGGR